MNMIQMECGVIPSIVKKEKREDYIKSLAESQDNDNPDSFIRFMFVHHVDNLKIAISEYKQSIENDTLNLKNDTLNDTLKLSDKEKNIIDLIKKQKDISISEIMFNTGFSRPTVTRSIDSLKKKGLLVRVGAKKNGYWKIV